MLIMMCGMCISFINPPLDPPAARPLGPRRTTGAANCGSETGSGRRYPSGRPARLAAARRGISGHFRSAEVTHSNQDCRHWTQ